MFFASWDLPGRVWRTSWAIWKDSWAMLETSWKASSGIHGILGDKEERLSNSFTSLKVSEEELELAKMTRRTARDENH